MKDTQERGTGPDGVVRVVVSYAWSKDQTSRSDPRWTFIRDIVRQCCDEARKRALKLDTNFLGAFTVVRLRATHGEQVLPEMIKRISGADVYLADIAGANGGTANPNVMMEVGVALHAFSQDRRRTFLLKPEDVDPPSNLSGLIWTNYTARKNEITLDDHPGFRAAMVSSLIGRAIDRGLLVSPLTFIDDGLDDDGGNL